MLAVASALSLCFNTSMTLGERLALAREIAARTKPRFVVDNTREEMRQARFAKAKPSPSHQIDWLASAGVLLLFCCV